MNEETLHTLTRADGVALRALHRPGSGPTLVFLPGLRSSMRGDKAEALSRFAADSGQAFLRLDYSGHGESDGRFEEGGRASWRDDALALVESLVPDGMILIGSSMGGWIGLMLAIRLGARVQGFVGVAPSPDFTLLIETWLDDAQRDRLSHGESVVLPGHPDLPITARFLAEGRDCRLMHQPLPISCPVRILQGQRDDAVPWRTALDIIERIAGSDCQVVLVKDGDHRLSRPQDLALLCRTVESLRQT